MAGGVRLAEGGGEGGEEAVAEAEVALEGREGRTGARRGDFHGIEGDILIDYRRGAVVAKVEKGV